jgi:hypothetical protein
VTRGTSCCPSFRSQSRHGLVLDLQLVGRTDSPRIWFVRDICVESQSSAHLHCLHSAALDQSAYYEPKYN